MFERIKTKLVSLPGWLVVILVSLVIFHRWFTQKLLTSGDWSFHFSQSMSEWLRLPMAWSSQTAFGAVNITSATWPFYFLGGIFGHLGLYSGVSDKFVFMLPIAVFTPLSSYLLARQVGLQKWGGIAAAAVYTLNTYALLLSTTQLTLLAGYALAPLALKYFIKSLEDQKNKACNNMWVIFGRSVNL